MMNVYPYILNLMISIDEQLVKPRCMFNALLILPHSLILLSMTFLTPPPKFVIFSKNFHSLCSVDASHYNVMMDI